MMSTLFIQNPAPERVVGYGTLNGNVINYAGSSNALKRHQKLLSTTVWNMIKLLVIGLGGFTGAILAILISGWAYSVTESNFPIGTLTVNLLGSFILGLIIGTTDHYVYHPNIKLFLTIGLLGAFTTFSTFSFETLALIEVNSYYKAFLNVFISIVFGLAAAFLGLILGRAL